MPSTPASLPHLGLLDGLGLASVGSSDTPAPLPHLGLLQGLGNIPLPSGAPIYSDHPIPVAWYVDPGFAAAYAWRPEGLPVANRDNIAVSTASIGSPAPLPHLSLLFDGSAGTGAVMYLRPRLAVETNIIRGTTGAVLYMPLRLSSGVWEVSGVPVPGSDLRAWLPPQRQRFGTVVVDGRPHDVYIDAASWYKFFQYIAEIKLGGANGASVPELVASLTATQATSATVEALTNAVAVQAQTNAEALSATVEVVNNNALDGADQIPPVRMTSYPIP